MRRLLFSLAFLLGGSLSLLAQQSPVEFESQQAWQHLVSDRPVIHATLRPAEQQSFGFFEGIDVKLLVDIGGNVTLAEAKEGPARLHRRAEELARALHFRPFEMNGVPVLAAIKIGIAILPPEKKPPKHIPFPAIKNWQSLRMRLTRSACFGSCPDYSLEVHGDGTVLYEGHRYVALEGSHRAVMAKNAVGDLLSAFRAADFFSLDRRYAADITDNPTYSVSIEFDGQKKTVEDYVGEAVGMPDAVARLEILLDRLTDSERWVLGNSNTVSSLAAEHWDFKSGESATALTRFAQEGKTDVVREMLAAGTPATAASAPGAAPGHRRTSAAASALTYSATRGDIQMLTALLGAGADVNEGQPSSPALAGAAGAGKSDAFRLLLDQGAAAGPNTLIAAAGSGNAETVKMVLGLHIDPNTQVEGGITALFNCANSNWYAKDGEKRNNVEVARVLLEAGADPNARTSDGETPLMKTHEAALAELLLARGADVNARDIQGETALLKTYSAEVTRVLLAHGADLMARDKSGKTALDRARQFNDKEMISAINQALSGRAK